MKNWWKYTIAFLVTLGIRLLPFRAPNLETIMTVQMPFAKKYGVLGTFLFGFLSILIYDIFTVGIGIWTFITALAYGFIGILAVWYFKNKTGRINYLKFAIFGTILYDALTGLTLGPIFWGQSFMVALIGQIPFTLIHLIGNSSFAILISPLIERWLAKEKKLVLKEKLAVI